MSDSDDTPGDDDTIELVEIGTEEVDEDGNVVLDDLVAALDSDGNIVATTETVIVVTPDGDVVSDETVSVAGDDGELHVIEENVEIAEADDEA